MIFTFVVITFVMKNNKWDGEGVLKERKRVINYFSLKRGPYNKREAYVRGGFSRAKLYSLTIH